MGCISSKLIIARSISFHEERNQRTKRTRANTIPLFALVCKASKLSNKLHSRSLNSKATSKLDIEHENYEVFYDKLELEPSILSQMQGGKQFESDHKNMSKSWHFLEHIEDKDHLRSKSDVGSRSYHTVEEYDDIVSRIWLNKSQIVQQSELNNEDDDGSEFKMDFQDNTQDKDSSIKKSQPLRLNKNDEVVPSHKTRMHEKGSKRMAIAKRLESLRIPSNVESPVIHNLKEWLPINGIYSPGSYVTPKFGSYSLINIRNSNESSEDSIFTPELVSAFEQCMQKLEAEEENILKQILENVGEEIDEGIIHN